MTREEAIAELKAQEEHLRGMSIMGREAYYMAIEALKEPERKKGKWIKPYKTNPEIWMCSECHYIDEPKWPYCHKCGAKMEEK